MDKKNRETLKKYFIKGSLPSEQEFAYLIDSNLNTIDDGFEKTEEEGLKISSLGKSKTLAGFYKNIEDKSAIWSIEFDGSGNSLLFNGREGKPVLALNQEGRVGINTLNPGTELDVAGVLACQGRMGTFKGQGTEGEAAIGGKVAADGKPHTILEKLDGCQAFEIMAGAGGGSKSGKYALVHAIAMNTFNSKGIVDVRHAYYGSRCNRIDLWWEGKQQDYALKIKTRCCYGEGTAIQYHITNLWFDPYMENCKLPPKP